MDFFQQFSSNFWYIDLMEFFLRNLQLNYILYEYNIYVIVILFIMIYYYLYVYYVMM